MAGSRRLDVADVEALLTTMDESWFHARPSPKKYNIAPSRLSGASDALWRRPQREAAGGREQQRRGPTSTPPADPLLSSFPSPSAVHDTGSAVAAAALLAGSGSYGNVGAVSKRKTQVRPLDLSKIGRPGAYEDAEVRATRTPDYASARSTQTTYWRDFISRPTSPRASTNERHDPVLEALLLRDLDSPRTFDSCLSVISSLPQNHEELESLPLDDLVVVAEQAEYLQNRAATTARLAREGLRRRRMHAQGSIENEISRFIAFVIKIFFVGSFTILNSLVNIGRYAQKVFSTVNPFQFIFYVIGAVVGILQAIMYNKE